MATFDALMKAIVSRVKPSPAQDLTEQTPRLSRYRDVHVIQMFPGSQSMADEGSLFMLGGTPGTGIATIAALSTYVDTSPFVVIQNVDSAGGKRVYPRYIKLICTAAGTGGTAIRFGVKLDGRRTAPTGGGSGFNGATPINCNIDDASASVSRVYAGALVAPAATSSVRQLGSGLLRPVIPVVGDTYMVCFGETDISANSLAPAGTAICDRYFGHPAVVIGPGQDMYFHIFLASQSAASSWEVELGMYER